MKCLRKINENSQTSHTLLVPLRLEENKMTKVESNGAA